MPSKDAGTDTTMWPPGTVRTEEKGALAAGGVLILQRRPTSDPNDPLNWPSWRKYMNIGLVCFWVAVVAEFTKAPTPTWSPMQNELGYTDAILNDSYAAGCAALGLGSLVMIPFVLKFGRRPLYLLCTVVQFGVSVWSARMRTVVDLMLINVIQCFFASLVESIVQMTIADVFFGSPYNFTSGQVGLMHTPRMIGVTIGAVITGPLSDWWIVYIARRRGGIYEPESRLWCVVPFLPFIPTGVLLFGIGLNNGLPWPVIAVGLALYNVGVTPVNSIVVTYLTDCYREIIGDALVGVTLIRNAFSTAFIFALTPWKSRLGCSPDGHALFCRAPSDVYKFDELRTTAAHRHTTDRYTTSKLANLHYARALAERHSRVGVKIIPVHPGMVATNLHHASTGAFLKPFLYAAILAGTPVEKGALSQVFASVSPEAEHGRYYGPVGKAES
ncbi:uncharacterized protein BDV17DRAFT_289085 [Aspergillus undulatus]|uniref:uncharacterized protein n=1 Tax=Aspergillus undulatus TaxID=1810928 RepID=UPI003CCD6AFE